MTATELPDKLTPLDIGQLAECIMAHAPTMPIDGVLLLTSHIWFETGGTQCHCWNLGNVKASPTGSYDYCYYPAGEELPVSMAYAYKAKDPLTVSIVGEPYLDKATGTTKVSVKFLPKHPACCFRAFKSLDMSVADFIATIRNRYSNAWDVLVNSGSPADYAHALKSHGYYTLDESRYASRLEAVWSEVCKKLHTDPIGELVRDNLSPETGPIGD